jgi:hypothetical protein
MKKIISAVLGLCSAIRVKPVEDLGVDGIVREKRSTRAVKSRSHKPH